MKFTNYFNLLKTLMLVAAITSVSITGLSAQNKVRRVSRTTYIVDMKTGDTTTRFEGDYDFKGNCIATRSYYIENAEWKFTYRNFYTYDQNYRQIKAENYINRNSVWILSSSTNYTYDEQGRYKEILEQEDSLGYLVNFQKKIFFYNDTTSYYSKVEVFESDKGNFALSAIYTITYDNENRVIDNTIEYPAKHPFDWKSRSAYTYEEGKMTIYTEIATGDKYWDPQRKFVEYRNQSGKKTFDSTFTYFDRNTPQLETSRIYAHYPNGDEDYVIVTSKIIGGEGYSSSKFISTDYVEFTINNLTEASDHFSPVCYPNPATDVISLNESNDPIVSYRIFDAQGFDVTAFTGKVNNTSINIEKLKPGLYNVEFNFQSGSLQTSKIIVE